MLAIVALLLVGVIPSWPNSKVWGHGSIGDIGFSS
ncbi:DUF3309 family protein [Candidatus Nitrotoga sp. M5]|nr:DUF3309 family protein [Candidatus Nitrotoga sp. M5]